jgi:hypothetical protein
LWNNVAVRDHVLTIARWLMHTFSKTLVQH